MSILSSAEVKRIADLARMSISQDEADVAAKNVSGILENFETIRSIDTTHVPPADDVSGLQNITREDIARDGALADPALLLKNAKTKNGYVQVSAVFTEQSVP